MMMMMDTEDVEGRSGRDGHDSGGGEADQWAVQVTYTGEQRDGAHLFRVSVGFKGSCRMPEYVTTSAGGNGGDGGVGDDDAGDQLLHRHKRYACFVEFRERLQGVFAGDAVVRQACAQFPSKWSLRSLHDRAEKLQRFLSLLASTPHIQESFAFRHFLGLYQNATLYKTLTYCPACVFLKWRKPSLLPASVVERDGGIYLQASCPAHAAKKRRGKQGTGTAKNGSSEARDSGQLQCLLCSDASAYLGWAASTIAVSGKLASCGGIDSFARAAEQHPPFVKLIPLLRAHKPLPHEELEALCAAAVRSEREAGSSFSRKRVVVRFRDPHTVDPETVNAVMHEALPLTRGHRIVLDLNPTCMAAVAALSDSCLLVPRVYPLITTSIPANRVQESRLSLVVALGEVAAYKDINVAVDINITRPYPDLTSCFDSLRSKPMVRLLCVTAYRSKTHLTKMMQQQQASFSGGSSVDGTRVVLADEELRTNDADILDVVDHVCSCMVDDGLTRDDFFGVSCLAFLEIILLALGFGRYPVSMSPSAGCAAVLIALEDEVVSLTRVVDVDRMWALAMPHINRLRQSNYGLITARSALSEARKAFMECVRPGMLEKYPNLRVDFDMQTRNNMQWLVERTQIVFVRRQPDAASFDAAVVLDSSEDTSMRQDAVKLAKHQSKAHQ